MKLADACILIADCPHTTAPDEGAGFPLVRTPNVGYGRLVYDAMHRVSENVYHARNKRATPQPYDLIYAREAPAGNVAVIQEGETVCLGQRTVLLRPNPKIVNPSYLAYYLLLPENRHRLVSIASGATVAHVNMSDIRDLDVSFPSIDKQTQIAAIINVYYETIANCRRQIALLEEASMRLYKECFKDGKGEKKRLGDVIDFDPPVKLPKGVKRFSVPMGALQVNSMVLDRNAFEITTGNSGSKFNNGDTLLARITPCLENGKTAFVFGVDEEGACGSTEFIVMRSKTLNPFAVYLLARTESFRKVAIASMSGADGRQRARKEVIANHEIFVPEAESIEKLGELCKPMFAQVETLQNQIYSFSEARDRLLPKLMKGEIAV